MEWNKDFAEKYQRVYGDRFSQALTDKQAAFIASLITPGGKIADVPCGWGRHSEALAKLGFIVRGVDLYNVKEKKEGNPTYEIADMRTWRGRDYDAVVSLFSSFGYFSGEENEKVLENAVQSVKVGGKVIVDVLNPEMAGIDTGYTGEHNARTEYDPKTRLLTFRYTVDDKEIYSSFYNYSSEELQALFEKYHCPVVAMYGSFNGEPYTKSSRRLILVGTRSG